MLWVVHAHQNWALKNDNKYDRQCDYKVCIFSLHIVKPTQCLQLVTLSLWYQSTYRVVQSSVDWFREHVRECCEKNDCSEWCTRDTFNTVWVCLYAGHECQVKCILYVLKQITNYCWNGIRNGLAWYALALGGCLRLLVYLHLALTTLKACTLYNLFTYIQKHVLFYFFILITCWSLSPLFTLLKNVHTLLLLGFPDAFHLIQLLLVSSFLIQKSLLMFLFV